MARRVSGKCVRCEREKKAQELGEKALNLAWKGPATEFTRKRVKMLMDAMREGFKMADRALCRNPENCRCPRPTARSR